MGNAPTSAANAVLKSGVEARQRGDLKAAIAEFKKSLAADPGNLDAHIDLGEVRQKGSALDGVTADMLPHVHAAMAGAFHIAFLSCAIAMAAALIVAMGMRDLPLRTSSAAEPGAEPAALAH